MVSAIRGLGVALWWSRLHIYYSSEHPRLEGGSEGSSPPSSLRRNPIGLVFSNGDCNDVGRDNGQSSRGSI